jgi:hypothetical protein
MPGVSNLEFVTFESGGTGVRVVSGLAEHFESDGEIVENWAWINLK